MVPLDRTIAYGDVVVVAQDLAGCRGARALRITVPCVDPPVAAHPADLDLYPVGTLEYRVGASHGRLFYPAETDGDSAPFHRRLASLGRVPVVVMAHGNHDPATPSFLGYDYFQQDLARMGIVSVSIDANAWNGRGYSIPIIEGRADLILSTIRVLQGFDADAGSPLFGKLDFSRTGLLGHSQGGEAVVLAPQVATLPGVTFRAVLALALTEGAPPVAGRPATPS